MTLNSYMYNTFYTKIPINFIRLIFAKTIFEIGRDTFISINVHTLKTTDPKSNIVIGNNCFINPNVLLDGRGGKLFIGNNVDISRNSSIYTLEHNPHDDYHSIVAGDVIIEDYVWISTGVTILPGVRIGRGAVVASGAIVTKDVAPMSIVGGIPAKNIGMRHSNLKYTINFNPYLYV